MSAQLTLADREMKALLKASGDRPPGWGGWTVGEHEALMTARVKLEKGLDRPSVRRRGAA